MRGANPKRPAVNSDGKNLGIQEIFPTKQGEGPYTGKQAIFIRLGGCNLACTFCDTEFESFSSWRTEDVISKAVELSNDKTGNRIRKLVVITGGEPFRQPIEYLCQRLVEENFLVQIETNGTLYRDLPEEVEIICSPKNIGSYTNIRDDLLSRARALKFIISASDKKYSFVPEVGQKKYDTEIYLQPMDEYDEQKNKANFELAEELCRQNGYKLSLQMHKIWGIP